MFPITLSMYERGSPNAVRRRRAKYWSRVSFLALGHLASCARIRLFTSAQIEKSKGFRSGERGGKLKALIPTSSLALCASIRGYGGRVAQYVWQGFEYFYHLLYVMGSGPRHGDLTGAAIDIDIDIVHPTTHTLGIDMSSSSRALPRVTLKVRR